MKHLFTISFLFFLVISNAQGNLQFNQVLTYGGTLCASCNQPIGTVPAGKVWKVEFKEGGALVGINGINLSFAQLPCWLKNGDVVFMNGNNSSTQAFFLSIIEFNIVP
jgi:hypothetical protein